MGDRTDEHSAGANPRFPRGGRVLIKGIPWLARAIDKGRMALAGRLGEYLYPCGMDREILDLLALTPDEFLSILKECSGDEEVLQVLSGRISALLPGQWMRCESFLVRYSRLLDEQEREEGVGAMPGLS